MRLLLLALLLALPVRADETWSSALTALQAGNGSRARPLLEKWIAEKAAEGIDSPEAHFNLALACWQDKDPGCASFHLLKSAQLRASPFTAWLLADKVTEIEREVGMKDGISDDFPFRAYLIFDRRWQWWLSAIAGWLSVGGTLLLFQRRFALRRAPALGLYAAACGCMLFAGAAGVNQRYFSHYAVLAGAKPVGVPLLRNPASSGDDNKLADLPNGVVVSVGETQDGVTHVTSPVNGWVASESLKAL